MMIDIIYKRFQENPHITTDSRNCPEGSIYVALKGERFNGNEFAAKALDAGSAYAIIDEEQYNTGDSRLILVDDCLKTLQTLARHHRRMLNKPVIAITGTNGKTTTKELTAAVLSKKYNVLFTKGNLNNHIGVPLTLLQMTQEHDIAVIEMGANHPGEIKMLSEIAEPNFGMITNIGKAHLEGFGSFEGVIKTKGELYDYIRRTGGKIFIHNENSILRDLSHGIESIVYGEAERLYVSGRITGNDPFLSFLWKQVTYTGEVHSKLIGTYNLANALAAVAVGCFFNVEKRDISQALNEYEPQNNRSQLKDTAFNHVIIDAYNANPTSMNAALRNFHDMAVENKTLILGDMFELGETTLVEHKQIVDLISALDFNKVILAGEIFSQIESEFTTLADTNSLLEYLKENPVRDSYILIKGSRGMALEKCIEHL
ncbi:MAG: UDP-N-acetylmuramoyl-tripeptide--D-alanyl-D-alanine ligase [Bacteroidales bacterium]